MSEPVQGVLGQGRAALTVGVLLAIAVFAVEGMGVVPALPTAVRELGGLELFGWALSAFMLAWIVGSVGGGLIADGRGPRLPMALGLACFGAGLLTAASAHTMTQLLAGRALQGVGGGGIVAAAYVAIARGYPDALRARMMALNSSVWVLPAVLGPAVSGKVTEAVGWRWVFVGVVPFLFVCAALVLRPLARYDMRLPLPSTRRVRAAMQLAAGAALLIFAPSLRSRGSIAVVLSVAVGLLLGVRGFRIVLPRGTLFAARGLPAGLAVRGLLGFSFFGSEAFVPLGAARLRGATPTEAGLALSAAAIGWVASSWIGERIEARSGDKGRVARVRLGFVGLAAGIALVGAALSSSLPLWMIPLGWAVSGVGVGLAFTTNGLIAIAAAPAGEEGNVSGQLQLVEALGTSAGAGLGGAALAALDRAGWSLRDGQLAVFSITFGAAVLGAAIAPRLAKRE